MHIKFIDNVTDNFISRGWVGFIGGLMDEYTGKCINDEKTMDARIADEDSHFEYLKSSLDHVCSEIAKRFSFYLPNGEPRTAAIIDILASSPRIEQIVRKLQQQHRPNIDAVYLENHKLAVGILVERLRNFLAKRGFEILVLTGAESNHGTTDVLIVPTRYGVNLQHNGKKIVIEVKTGKSLSYSQLFRYFFDVSITSMILWRIKKRQVAVLRRKRLQLMLQAYMEMCILRGKRVLSFRTREHQNFAMPKNFTLSSKKLENTVNDFAEGLMETLPVVLDTVLGEIRSTHTAQRNE